MNREEFIDRLSKRRADYEEKLRLESHSERRVKYKWKFILDEKKKVLEKPIRVSIFEIDTDSLRKILDDKDYDNKTNSDIVLKTIWDEYHNRKSHRI